MAAAAAISEFGPLLLVGAGHMGGALLTGWRRAGALAPADLLILDPQPGEAARGWIQAGAAVAGPDDAAALGAARSIVLAVKPQVWRQAAAPFAGHLGPEAPLISIMAGPTLADLRTVFGSRPLGRAMPNLAAAALRGAAAIHAPDAAARALALALFSPVATVIELPREAQLHAATAVAGSGPAYVYAFTEALAEAGAAAGLEAEAALAMATATVAGAAALMAESGEAPAALRAAVTSPGGTTAAALSALQEEDALARLLREAVERAVRRSCELSG
ncbi:MAG TPA: pyrroline-5-carboxylate reductase [Caulobacteraceae bacterium]|nr:pyrroline-5-carboxylate reductase [Caulobacteraceae bacterium]